LQWRKIRLQERHDERVKAQVFAVGLAGALLLCPTLALAINGTASVTDGDTLRVGGEVIRLHGIDAPEGEQTCRRASGAEYDCGMAASRALANAVGRSRVSCEAKDKDQYGRMVAVCRVGSTVLNELLVREGHALAYRRYSEEYVGAEESARTAMRGMWAGQFLSPWEWRAQHRAAAPAQPTPQAGCPIKANISSKGEKIFHVPGGRDYGRTRISTEAGERWFCTEAEALRAGWRAAK
jgi:endonuclease YncB( thermonuclease family)